MSLKIWKQKSETYCWNLIINIISKFSNATFWFTNYLLNTNFNTLWWSKFGRWHGLNLKNRLLIIPLFFVGKKGNLYTSTCHFVNVYTEASILSKLCTIWFPPDEYRALWYWKAILPSLCSQFSLLVVRTYSK